MTIKKKGQVSVEYLAIFSVAALMMIPLIIIFAFQTERIEADVSYAQAENVLSRIIASAEEIYFQGPPAQKTIRVHFPKNIEEISIEENEIFITLQTIDGSFLVSKVTSSRLSGTLKTFPGEHSIKFEAFEEFVLISEN